MTHHITSRPRNTDDDAYDAAMIAAASAGEAAGTDAAINYVTRDNAAALLSGLNAGDPAVEDGMPYLDLSGQWADGTTDRDVLREIEAWANRVDASAGDFVYAVGVAYGSAAGNSEALETATALVETYRDAFNQAVSEKIETDAIATLRAINVDEIESLNAYALANAADCGCPDALDSAGAAFLTGVRNAFVERYNHPEHGETFNGDDVSDIADAAPDYRNLQRWQEFTDLAAWQEDITEFCRPDASDLTTAAGVALYMIAERLVIELARRASIDLRRP